MNQIIKDKSTRVYLVLSLTLFFSSNVFAGEGTLPNTFVYAVSLMFLTLAVSFSLIFAYLTSKVFEIISKNRKQHLWIQTFSILITAGSYVFLDGGIVSSYPFKYVRLIFGNEFSLETESIIFIIITLILILFSSFIGFKLTKVKKLK